MSNALFPVLPGRKWSSFKAPSFSTSVKEMASGRRTALGNRFYPLWRFKISYEWLREGPSHAEMQTLLGFFLARRGRLDDFLYEDRDDRIVSTPVAIGVGNGSTRVFQLARSWAGFVEPVYGVKTVAQVRVNGSPVAHTVDALGRVTLSSAPAIGAVVDWTGEFYHRVAFVQDETEAEEFLRGLWRGQVEFKTSPP